MNSWLIRYICISDISSCITHLNHISTLISNQTKYNAFHNFISTQDRLDFIQSLMYKYDLFRDNFSQIFSYFYADAHGMLSFHVPTFNAEFMFSSFFETRYLRVYLVRFCLVWGYYHPNTSSVRTCKWKIQTLVFEWRHILKVSLI